MKIKMTLYGCADYFNGLEDGGHVCFLDLQKAFGIQFRSAVPEKKPAPMVEVGVNQQTAVIPRTYIADIELAQDGDEGAVHADLLEKIAFELGELWMEFVRTFIDSGGLIAARIFTKEKRAIWSPHGTGL